MAEDVLPPLPLKYPLGAPLPCKLCIVRFRSLRDLCHAVLVFNICKKVCETMKHRNQNENEVPK